MPKYEGNIAELLYWATNRGRAGQSEKAPEPYFSWMEQFMPKWDGVIGHWVGSATPDAELDGDWIVGFPHIHTISVKWPPEAFTVITYLVAPEEGGEFALGGLSPDDPYKLIKPEPGLTVMCDAQTWHGVKPVKKGNRVSLINTKFPT